MVSLANFQHYFCMTLQIYIEFLSFFSIFLKSFLQIFMRLKYIVFGKLVLGSANRICIKLTHTYILNW